MSMKNIRWSYCFTLLLILSTFSASCAQQTGKKEVAGEIERSLTTQLNRIKTAPLNEKVALYHAYKAAHPDAHLEEEVNMYGYTLLWDGKTAEALAFFELVVNDYPESSNAYDSYAEALMVLGRNEEAIENYEKSLALDPSNFNAEDQIERIKFPDKKPLSPEEKFALIYDIEAYKSDLDQLVKDILENHPNPTKFTSQEKWEEVLAAKKALITAKTTYADFSWHCNEIVAMMNCSHSGMSRFWEENRMIPLSSRFPLQTRWVEGKLYVIDPLDNADRIKIKDQIVRINGTAVEDILEDIFRHITSQGYVETTKRHEFNMFSTGMIASSLGFPTDYEVKLLGEEKSIKLKPTSTNPDPARDKTIEDCGGDLCLNYLDTEKKIGIMTIQSFNYYERQNYDEFVQFMDASMAEMKEAGTTHLMLDLRGNGGGSPESSIYLLRYLMKEPFIYSYREHYDSNTDLAFTQKLQQLHSDRYQGQLYFLIDGVGNSTTGHFMSLVKKHQLGTIIGEELGSNQFCNAGMTRLRLKNTKLNFHVANNTHISTANELPDEKGILPDHEIYQSIEEYLAGEDAVKTYAIELIQQQTNWQPASPYHSSFFLDADESLQKELFQIPLSFAPNMSVRGLEDARFLPSWNDPEHEQFWSYAFAWNLRQEEVLTTDEIATNIEMYFDGLMRVEQNANRDDVSPTSTNLEKVKTDGGKHFYEGSVTTFDNFFQKKPLKFNVKVEQLQCKDIGRTMLVFRFSKQEFDSKVWNELAKIKLPQDICKE